MEGRIYEVEKWYNKGKASQWSLTRHRVVHLRQCVWLNKWAQNFYLFLSFIIMKFRSIVGYASCCFGHFAAFVPPWRMAENLFWWISLYFFCPINILSWCCFVYTLTVQINYYIWHAKKYLYNCSYLAYACMVHIVRLNFNKTNRERKTRAKTYISTVRSGWFKWRKPLFLQWINC